MNRRDFLLSAASLPLLGKSALAIDPIPRTRPSHLKLSLAAYSFRDDLTAKAGEKPKIDLFDFVNLAADYAIDAVELTSYYFPPSPTADYLHRLKQHAFQLGLDVSGTSVGNDFCVPPGPKREAELDLVKTWVDNAAELDAPVIRIFAGTTPKGEKDDVAFARTIECIKIVLPYAERKGVALAIENHGGITATPEQLLKIVKAIDAPNFGVNLDTGNFHSEDPYAELATLAPYAINVQLKTEIAPKGKPKVDADLGKLIGILRQARYSGYVVLEYEAREDAFQAVPRHLKTLRALIS